MKLIFNPFYDAMVFVKTEGCVVGEKVVGPQGLLDELELRAGLTGRFRDDFQRAILYSRAMKKALESKTDLFFAKSYEKDKLGTAIIILRWRDALVKIGWDKKNTGCIRIDDMALVEKSFDEKGEGDRWRQILEYAQKSALLDKDDCIEVTCKKDNVEPLYRQLFESMESKGGNVKYALSPIDNNIHEKADVYSFKNDIEMAEWLAQQTLGENDVVVCNDTSILNLDMALNGKPQVGSSNNAIGAIMQIFTLGLVLFNKPVNVNSLLAYLQLPATPLSAVYVKRQDSEGKDYYKSLRRALLAQLLDDNGISEKWNELINEAVYDYEGNDVSKSDKRKKALLFINQWEKVSALGDDCTIEKVAVVEYLQQMKRWAKTNLFDEEKASQFNAIVDYCDTMLLILEDEPETIKTHNLKLWASQIIRPVELATMTARKGSFNVTDAVTNLYSAPETLYWDCTMTEYGFGHELDFLTPGEIDALKKNNIEMADRESLLKTKREMMLSALSKVQKRIVMLECEVMGGVLPVEDPVATELRLGGKLAAQQQAPNQDDMEENPVEAASTKQNEYKVLPIDFQRESESYSSLDELIQRPFDYVMDYILRLKEYGKAAMDDMDTLKGHVAHTYMEKLTDEGARNVADMRNIHNSRFDAILNRLVETNGALLQLEENDLEFKRFKSLLKKSVDILLEIIEHNQLSIVGAEQKYEADIHGIGNMNATIDYVLTDINGNYVILDFKWNEGMTYERKLVANDALQLAVYRAVLEQYLKDTGDNHKVSFMGYYVLPRHTLYTVYETMHHHDIKVVVPEKNDDLMTLAANSYAYRMDQLKAGIVEEGETLALSDLQYTRDTVAKGLYPLRQDYNNTSLKGISYGNKNIVLKGGLI